MTRTLAALCKKLSAGLLAVAATVAVTSHSAQAAENTSRSGDGDYTLVATVNGKCLSNPAGSQEQGKAMIQWTCNSASDQVWTRRGNTLVNEASGQCLSDPAGSQEAGRAMIQWTCNGESDQVWDIKDGVSGSVMLVNGASGQCLDVPHGKPDDGLGIVQYPCADPDSAGGRNQQWQLKPFTPPPGQDVFLRINEDGAYLTFTGSVTWRGQENRSYKVTGRLYAGCSRWGRTTTWLQYGGSNEKWKDSAETECSEAQGQYRDITVSGTLARGADLELRLGSWRFSKWEYSDKKVYAPPA
jgi:hypothetical protein